MANGEIERRNAMSAERFALIVDAYGADARRWPEAERRLAEAWAADHPEAARMLAEARSLDRLLDALPTVAPSSALVERILASTPRASRPLAAPRPGRPGLGERLGGWLGALGGFEGAQAQALALPRLSASSLSLLAASALLGLTLGIAGPVWLTGMSEAAAYEMANADAFVLAFGARGLEDGSDLSEGTIQ